jgi:hypothetical protein
MRPRRGYPWFSTTRHLPRFAMAPTTLPTPLLIQPTLCYNRQVSPSTTGCSVRAVSAISF